MLIQSIPTPHIVTDKSVYYKNPHNNTNFLHKNRKEYVKPM